MSATPPISRPGPVILPALNEPSSVKKDGELPEERLHLPQRVSPNPPYRSLRPLPLRNTHDGNSQPHPNSGQVSKSFKQHPRYLIPRNPLTIGTHHPNENPSPSIDSQSSGDSSDTILSLPNPTVGLFAPYPAPPPQPSTNYGSCASPTSTIDLTSRTSIATEYLFRQSTTSSSVIRLSDIPPFPPPWYPPPTEDSPRPQDDPCLRAAGLISPLNPFHSPGTNVSIIPPNIPNPRWTRVSLASSQAIPTSWGYDFKHHSILSKDTNIEKGDRLKIRTISMPRTASIVSTLESPTLPLDKSIFKQDPTSSSARLFSEDASRADSISPVLSEAGQRQNTKDSFILQDHTSRKHDEKLYSKFLTKEIDVLPKPAATIDDKRSSFLKPPHSETGVVRDVEARSTTPLSLIDLIRSANELASSSEHGNTASRTGIASKSSQSDLCAASKCRRDSGSFSEMLAEFPPPGLPASKGRGFLPVSLWRSKRRNIEYIESDKFQGSSATPPKRRCFHGLSQKKFILICMLVSGTILLVILLPVLLVARSKATSTTSCEKTTPCLNGGISVSIATGCSCVCANGYTGVQCTTTGDSSCVISDVTSSKNATMGNSLPSVLDLSQIKFGIPLDQDAIMALFSTENVSCKTENKLVSFSEVDISSDTDNTRRSSGLPMDEDKLEILTMSFPTTRSNIVASRSLATKNGILYDQPDTNSTTAKASTGTKSKDVTTVALQVVEFSQVAVLYILEKTGSFDSTVNAKEIIQSYLVECYNSTVHPSLQVLGSYTLDFENKTIALHSGAMIGG